MARKRMISPSMWESESFSELNDVAKLVFISLISHADDEGRGKASPAYIKSMTFPNDENRRVADIKSALSEIARCMSVQFYSADGRDYYVMTNWTEYQKIDKPTKSKLPPPHNAGEVGAIPNRGQFAEDSESIRGVVDEDYTPKSSQVNRIEDNNLYDSQTGGELEFYLETLKYHLEESDMEPLDKLHFNDIVAELVRRNSLKINGVETPATKILQAFVQLFVHSEKIPDLLYAGDKKGVKNKFLYTVSALYNGAYGF